MLNSVPRFHNERDISIFKILAEDIRSGKNQYLNVEELKKLYTEKTGKTSSVHKYHVLKPDQPSNTIREKRAISQVSDKTFKKIKVSTESFTKVGSTRLDTKTWPKLVPIKFVSVIL